MLGHSFLSFSWTLIVGRIDYQPRHGVESADRICCSNGKGSHTLTPDSECFCPTDAVSSHSLTDHQEG